MPRQSRKSPTKKARIASQDESFGVNFVNINLDSEDKAVLQSLEFDSVEVFQELERLAEDGYKISLSIDLNNTGGIAAITGKKGCRVPENEGFCLVSRGPDLRGAVLSMLYKLTNYCPDGVFPAIDAPRDADFS